MNAGGTEPGLAVDCSTTAPSVALRAADPRKARLQTSAELPSGFSSRVLHTKHSSAVGLLRARHRGHATMPHRSLDKSQPQEGQKPPSASTTWPHF